MSLRAYVAAPSRDRTTALAICAAVPLVALAGARAHSAPHFLLLAGFTLTLLALAACDLATLLLPNRIMYPGLLCALAAAGLWPDRSWTASLAGGGVGGVTMLTVFLVMPGFGFGDVKLCALIGLIVGWPAVFSAIFLGAICNAIVIGAGLLLGRLRLKGVMPYGPGLVAGALFILLRAHL